MAKRLVSLLLVLSFITPLFYNPYQARKASAFLGFGDIVVDIKALVERIADNFAMVLAQQIIDRMVASTVKWMQSGFEGNPGYVTNPKQYFTDIADGVAGGFIQGSDLNFLCSPFQANIKLSLAQEYYEPQPFQCTLTDVIGNTQGAIDDFYNDFSKGGWDAWFSMTQNPTNNPYGAYLKAKVELDSRIASAVGIKKDQLNWDQGFLSYQSCDKKNPPEVLEEVYDEENNTMIMVDTSGRDPTKAVGECIKYGPTETPGSTLKAQLDKVLPSGLEKLITAQHIDQLVSGFAAGILNRYVFGPKGIFAKRSNTSGSSSPNGSGGTASSGSSPGNSLVSRFSQIDLDGDKIADGQDFDRDGRLESVIDICFHGGEAPNCALSNETPNSPYFSDLCQAVEDTVGSLTDYTKFIEKNADQLHGGASLRGQIIGAILAGPVGALFGGLFGSGSIDNFKEKADAELWANRTTTVDSSVNDVMSEIRKISIDYFDNLEITTNRFSFYIGKVLESLIKDKDLDLARVGSGGGGLANLMKHSAYNLRYFKEVKDKLGRCDAPRVTELNDIPLPPQVEPAPPGGSSGGSGGGQCSVSGQRHQGALSQAMDQVTNENPEVANLPNIESGGRQNARRFLALVVSKLKSMGYEATDSVLNGNNNPNTGDLIALWKSGDITMERYDVIEGEKSPTETLENSVVIQFTGFIPLNCTASGGGKDCGCKSNTSGGSSGSGGGSGGSGSGSGGAGSGQASAPAITSVNPTTVTPGSTTITISGTNLTSTVQFFSSNGARNTVVGTLNSANTQVTVLVPAGIPTGSGSVRIYKDANTFSNSINLTYSAQQVAAVQSFEATSGFFGTLAHNKADNGWLVVSATLPLDTVYGRIMSNNGSAVTGQFKINTSTGVQVMNPKAVYSENLNKFLVVWIGFPDPKGGTIYGRFINADGSASGEPFVVFKDPTDGSGFSFLYKNSQLQYDAGNRKFVFAWEYRNPKVDARMITIAESGTVGTAIDVGEDSTGESWNPSVVVGRGEYCIAYDKRNNGKVAVRKYNPSTSVLSAETSTSPVGTDMSIVYNSISNKYLVGWTNVTNPVSDGRILNGCDINNAGSTFTLNSLGRTVSLAYNSKNNTFASIVQNNNDAGNTYNILSATGVRLGSGVIFTGGDGNYSPVIAANPNDGTFAAISSLNYAATRFAPNIKP